MTAPRTLYDKIWDDHVVSAEPDGTTLLYIDRHLVHEVTSPQAFEGLRLAHRKVHAPQKTLAVVDHNVPTTDRRDGIDNPESAIHTRRWQGTPPISVSNTIPNSICARHRPHRRAGTGFTLPGMTIVCGDSHTSTHGAFGALAHGIGTSEVEHVLATQTLIQRKARNMLVHTTGNCRRA